MSKRYGRNQKRKQVAELLKLKEKLKRTDSLAKEDSLHE